MIKQSWNITSEEKLRILNLHESATRNLYLIKEQNPSSVQGHVYKKLIVGQDENYIYYLSQPTQSRGSDYVNWNEDYYIYALDETLEKSYMCKITELDDKNRPKKVEVLKDKILPDIRKNEFLFALNWYGGDSHSYEPGNDITANAFVKQGKEESGLLLNKYYYACVWYNGDPLTLLLANEGPMPAEQWIWEYNDNEIQLDKSKINTKILFNPATDVFVTQKGKKLSKVIASLVTSYPMPEGFNKVPPTTPKKPPEIIPEPPQPVPLGDKFRDNISMPTVDAILADPKFIEFKKFVEGNDVSKFIFDIKSSASKCAAGYKEADRSKGRWSTDKDNYPDVTIDPDADTEDMGNLNLTKARAQNLKNFLVTNIPKLKDAKFRVVAQGSKGVCGTEAENAVYRVVNLEVTKL